MEGEIMTLSVAAQEMLRVEGLTKSFGSLRAVDDISLTVKRNEVRAIIGPNGAGKTTLFNLITGELKPERGKVFLKGREITSLPPHRIVGLGVSRSFQITNIFQELTVFENVMVPVLMQQGRQLYPFRSVKKITPVREEILSILRLVEIEQISDVKGHALSHGDKKRLEVAVVLACKPELLLLDEPTAGMSSEETRITVSLIKKVASDLGITIALTEHDMKVVFSVSDYISVLRQGRIIAEGLPDEVKNNKKVIEAYIGEKVE
jgi:branched-chain amino acid transport system ATP-binding protein